MLLIIAPKAKEGELCSYHIRLDNDLPNCEEGLICQLQQQYPGGLSPICINKGKEVIFLLNYVVYISFTLDIINDYTIPYIIAPDPCKGKTCGEMCLSGEWRSARGRCNSTGHCSFTRERLGCGKISHFFRNRIL